MRYYKFKVHFHNGQIIEVSAPHFDAAVIKACEKWDGPEAELPELIEREDGSSYHLKMIKMT